MKGFFKYTPGTEFYNSNGCLLYTSYFYKKIELHIGRDQASVSHTVVLERSVGRVDVDLNVSSDYMWRFIRKTVSYTHLLGGLEIGADAYITKPFSVGILKVTIKNILANRELLRQVYNSIENKEKHLPVNCTNTLDWKFIASVKECIEKNMGDLDFGVDVLSNQHHMSRTSFYNKLKALTGYAPADYIDVYKRQVNM